MNKKGITTLLIGVILIGITVLFYSNFSLYTEYYFNSKNYVITNGYIYNVSSYTTVELYKKYFDIKNYQLKIENTTDYISNGSKLLLLDKNSKLVSTLTNIVKGDIVSDGIIDDKDITKFEDYLKNNYTLQEYEKKCLDINDDNNITSADLNLLKSATTNGITSMGIREKNVTILVGEKYRLIVDIYPNYGFNTNLKWTSSNENIVSVDESGLVTAHNLGDVIITAQNFSGTITKEINIKVDNNLKLSSNEGFAFVTDSELAINIRAIDYKNLECQSSDSNISTCRIDDNTLYIKSLSKGNSIITVTSPNNGSTTYNLTSYESYLDFIPDYYCMPINRSDIVNLEYSYNNLSVTNNNLTNDTYFNNNQFYIKSMATPGREELTIKDINNSEKKMIIDVYNLNIPSIGAFIKKGTEKSATIVAQNTETLTCTSPDKSIADCYIKDNKLYVTGLNRGEVTLKITSTNTYNNKEYECGETTFLAVVSE